MGSSFAAIHLKAAAQFRGVQTCQEIEDSELVFISEDTPTDSEGVRAFGPIKNLIEIANKFGKPIILTSQVPPGFTRALGITNIFHQAETLRISDAWERAINPEQIIIGTGNAWPPLSYIQYLTAFKCPALWMSWEEAEFAKIAINMTLASQVENTNRLAKAAEKVGAKWDSVAKALALDSRIGARSYLKPGRWQDSKHLLRDAVTLAEIECRT